MTLASRKHHALGLRRARDAAEMQTVLDSLPQAPWLSMETTPLSEHPSDPGAVRS
ncbi:muconolactone Delta-isomerase family protein [Streptomyces sp. NPDC055134]